MFLRLLRKNQHRFIINKERDKYENVLENPNSKIGRMLARFISFIVFISVLMVVLETVWDTFERYWLQIFVLDFFISTVFLLEYIYRFWRAKDKIKFVKKLLNIIDVLSFLPFFISFWTLLFGSSIKMLFSFDTLKVLRIIRILRLLEFNSHSPITIWFLQTIKEYKREYKAILFLFLSILIIDSTFVYAVEHAVNADFDSIPKAMWWGIVTMTTVWYGDMYPVTILWKVFWTIIIFLWPLLLAVTSSITILVFMDVVELHKAKIEKVCNKCKTVNREDANYCYKCGSKKFVNTIVKKKVSRILTKK